MQRRDWMKGTLLTAGATMGAVAGWPGLARAASVERIGLLLPKSGQIYGRAAAALKAGIETAFRRLPKGFAIDIYETDESAKQLTAAYQGMLRRGTSLVIGPLTRNGTAALASFGEVPITTLALNQFEGDGSVPWNVLVFSIGVEQEAVQVADMAFQAMRRKASNPKAPRAIIITAANQVGRRAASVFHGQWQALGGEADLPIELEESALYKFREVAKKEQGDLYFLSMASHLARPVRMITGRNQPAFGTSQISIGGMPRRPSPSWMASGWWRCRPSSSRRAMGPRASRHRPRTSAWRCSASTRWASTRCASDARCSLAPPRWT